MIASWLIVAILGYFLAAVSSSVDRIIVHEGKTKPAVISFWVSTFSIATAALVMIGFLPFKFAEYFRFEAASTSIMLLAILCGFLTQFGIMFMYRALQYGEATRVLSVMGGLMPVVSFFAAYIFLDERLSQEATIGFATLIAATIVLTISAGGKHKKSSLKWLPNIAMTALILGGQSVLTKYVFDNSHFISAYSLTGIGAGVYAATLYFLAPEVKKALAKKPNKNTKTKESSNQVFWIFANSMLGGVAVILINLAISLGSPTLVNALRGVQYASIFLIVLLLGRNYPKLLDEDLSRRAILIKIAGILLTISGIMMLGAA